MQFKYIRYSLSDNILTVTLDRPDSLNAMNTEMAMELIGAFDRADADDNVRAIIVTGAGRAFCAGADISSGVDTFNYEKSSPGSDARPESMTREGPVHRDVGGLLTLRIYRCLKPVIAAINGAAVGIGITVTLPMDIRLVSRQAKIGFVFVRRGIVPDAASSYFLPRVVGIAQASEWCLTGRLFEAGEAHAGGLVSAVHEPEELLQAAVTIAREIVEHAAPVSVAVTRQMLQQYPTQLHPMDAHRIDSRMVQARGRSRDVREGISSFLDKRPAKFPDRVSADLPEGFPWWREPEFH